MEVGGESVDEGAEESLATLATSECGPTRAIMHDAMEGTAAELS